MCVCVLMQRFRGRMRRAVRIVLLDIPVDPAVQLLEAADAVAQPFVSYTARRKRQDTEVCILYVCVCYIH